MTDDLRDEIALALHHHLKWDDDTPDDEFTCCADAVLAIPVIADAVALAELCAPLTIEQVARALRLARARLKVVAFPNMALGDDEKAIATWEDKR